MSLEERLEALTTALEENTAALKAQAKGGSKKSSKDDDDDDDADDKKSKKRGRDAEDDDDDADDKKSKKGKGGKGDKDKGPTAAEVRKALAEFMATDDGEEDEEKNGFVERMFKHLKVKRAGDIDESDYESVLEWIEKAGDDEKFLAKPKFK